MLHREQLERRSRSAGCTTYFRDEILPVLSPLGLDPAHPFPRILNKSLNVVVVLEGKDAFGREGGMAIVRAPRSLPRIIQLPRTRSPAASTTSCSCRRCCTAFVDDLFPGMKVKGAYQFRVTRNSELFVDEEEVENLACALQGRTARPRLPAARCAWRSPTTARKPIVQLLLQNFELPENAVYRINGPVNLNRVIQVYDLVQPAGAEVPAVQAAAAPTSTTTRRSRRVRERRRAAAPSLRQLSAPVLDLVRQAAERSRTCWRSSRPCTAPARTRRSSST